MGAPIAAIKMSADCVIASRFALREWTTVTVASPPLPFCISKQRDWLAHDHASPQHDDVRARDVDLALDKQTLNAERRARNKAGWIARELGHIDRMKPSTSFARIERPDDRRFVDLLWRRRLDKDSVDCRIAV